MSRNFAVLSKALPTALHPDVESPPQPPAAPEGEFAAVIRLLFPAPAAVAIVGASDSGSDPESPAADRIAHGLADELAASGKRVVLVPVKNLLLMNPIGIPDPADFVPGSTPYVWVWPPPESQKIEFFRPAGSSRETGGVENWLDALRRDFDAVILDCPGVTEAAAMADAAVLAVHAGRTSAEQLRQCQQALQLRGARVVGCILVQPVT